MKAKIRKNLLSEQNFASRNGFFCAAAAAAAALRLRAWPLRTFIGRFRAARLPLNESGESGKCGGLLIVVMTFDGDNKNCNYIFINAIYYSCGFIDAAAPQAL